MRLASLPTLFLASAAVLLAACSDEVEETQAEVSRPVKTQLIGESEGQNLRRFPARIESSQRADLSFRVPGKVQEILVGEGERVEAGDVISRLDPSEYQLVVDDRRAQYEQAKADFERGEELLKRGVTTRQVFEDRKADFKSKEAALKLAEKNLGFTELKAPFGGEIARRFVENFEDVQAKQPVLSMRDLKSLEVKFDVPERIMIQLAIAEDAADIPEPDVIATFAAEPEREFPLEFRESAAFADPDTQTFEVTYTLIAPEDLMVLPGMTATAAVDFSDLISEVSGLFIPVEAVTAANDLSAKVWVVDESSMTIGTRPVEVGEMRGNLIEVTSGLEKGERVVTAGVPFLTEGMAVTLMPDIEQAAERQDDIRIRREAAEELQETEAEANSQKPADE
ncbi:efflux RND transporter periplasmic adaptor subunit [Rhodovibrionaceae bacterium A322]